MANQVHCAHILVKTEFEAKAVLERIEKGEKFTNIATQVSLCPSGKKGGDLGKFSRGAMVKEFENAAFALEKGEIFGYREDGVWISHYQVVRVRASSLSVFFFWEVQFLQRILKRVN